MKELRGDPRYITSDSNTFLVEIDLRGGGELDNSFGVIEAVCLETTSSSIRIHKINRMLRKA